MINTLHVKNVVIFDFQEPYSQGLGGQVEKTLKAAGVTTVAPVGPEHRDGLLAVRHEGAERRRHRVLPDAAARCRADVREPARRAGQEGEGLRRRRLERPRRLQGGRLATSRTSRRRSTRSRPTSPSSPPGRRPTPASPSAPSGPRPTAPCRSSSPPIKKACTAGKGSIPKRSAVITDMKKVTITKGWILGGKFSWSKVNTRDPNTTRVLHHADPVRRHLQARQLARSP